MSAQPLTASEARDKAKECRDMAERVHSDDHRIMLEHMAQTWDRIAVTLHTNGG